MLFLTTVDAVAGNAAVVAVYLVAVAAADAVFLVAVGAADVADVADDLVATDAADVAEDAADLAVDDYLLLLLMVVTAGRYCCGCC